VQQHFVKGFAVRVGNESVFDAPVPGSGAYAVRLTKDALRDIKRKCPADSDNANATFAGRGTDSRDRVVSGLTTGNCGWRIYDWRFWQSGHLLTVSLIASAYGTTSCPLPAMYTP
jgi:hypothetical protein